MFTELGYVAGTLLLLAIIMGSGTVIVMSWDWWVRRRKHRQVERSVAKTHVPG